jgi:hypothetical protein
MLATAAGLATVGLDRMLTSRASAVDFHDPPADAGGLSCYQNGDQVFVRWNNAIALGYRSQPSLKYPYFAPLTGPVSGISLTTESSLPYPHHRGLWLGCEPLNGGDFWSDGPLEQGHIRSNGLSIEGPHAATVAINDSCRWIRGDAASPLADVRQFTFSIPSERIRLLDVEFDLQALEDVQVAGAKHSFFALRAATDISPLYGGTLLNSRGDTGAAATFGRPAEWCGFFGRRAPSEQVEGISIFNHPENFGGNCPWFTRDYGHLSPSPFNFLDAPWTLERGAAIRLRYCVVLHAGTPREADLDNLYRQWIHDVGWFVALRNRTKREKSDQPPNTP